MTKDVSLVTEDFLLEEGACFTVLVTGDVGRRRVYCTVELWLQAIRRLMVAIGKRCCDQGTLNRKREYKNFTLTFFVSTITSVHLSKL